VPLVPLVPIALKDLAMTTRDDDIIPLDPPAADADEQPVVAPPRGYERR
jgi:hypothetical protein